MLRVEVMWWSQWHVNPSDEHIITAVMILSFETFRKLTYCVLCRKYIGVHTCIGTFVARTENAWMEYVADKTSRNWDSRYEMCLVGTLNKKRGCSIPSNLTLMWGKSFVLTLFGIDMCVNISLNSDMQYFSTAEFDTVVTHVGHT